MCRLPSSSTVSPVQSLSTGAETGVVWFRIAPASATAVATVTTTKTIPVSQPSGNVPHEILLPDSTPGSNVL